MALGDAILACLTEREMSGYDLAKRFDASIGFFWQANHQQIYRELDRLLQHGDVTVEDVPQKGKPNKHLYAITPAGRTTLRDGSRLPSATRSVRDDLLVRLYALEHVDDEAVRAQIESRLAHHEARIAIYEGIGARRREQEDPGVERTGRILVLEIGLRLERTWAEWCRLALAELGEAT